MADDTCSVEGCGKYSYTRTWCATHFFRWKYHGSLDLAPVRPATSEELAWAAGLFEGEGSISPRRNGKPRLQVKMTDEDVVRRLRDVVGGVVYGPYQAKATDGHDRKPYWVWTNGPRDPSEIFDHFRPWLGARRLERAAELGIVGLSPVELAGMSDRVYHEQAEVEG